MAKIFHEYPRNIYIIDWLNLEKNLHKSTLFVYLPCVVRWQCAIGISERQRYDTYTNYSLCVTIKESLLYLYAQYYDVFGITHWFAHAVKSVKTAPSRIIGLETIYDTTNCESLDRTKWTPFAVGCLFWNCNASSDFYVLFDKFCLDHIVTIC